MKLQRISIFSLALALILTCTQALPALAAAEGTFERTLQVSGPVNLDVTTGSGSIRVRNGGSGQVQVTGHIKATTWFGGNADEKVRRLQANPPIQQSGNDIRIGQIDDWDLRHNISISYELVVPSNTQLHSQTGSGTQTIEGIQGTVEASAGSGSVKITGIGSTVRAETGSGTIEVENVKGNVRVKAGSGSIRATGVAGGFDASTGSGHITLAQTAPGSVRVETGSGGIDASGVHGSLEARAGSGSIRAEGDPTGEWTVNSGSGSVQIRVPSNTAFDLDARTSSGSILLNHPVTVQGSVGKKHVQGKVGGGGVPLRVETGSGNIQIE